MMRSNYVFLSFTFVFILHFPISIPVFYPFNHYIRNCSRRVFKFVKKSEKEQFNIENFGPEVWLMVVYAKF